MAVDALDMRVRHSAAVQFFSYQSAVLFEICIEALQVALVDAFQRYVSEFRYDLPVNAVAVGRLGCFL